MTSETLARSIVARLRDAGHQAYLVGGCVRDLLLGRAPKDFDVATDARPEAERERKLGPDDGQVDLHRLGEIRQLDDVLDADGKTGRERRDSRVPRRAEYVAHTRRLRELPHERVLATPGADYEEAHASCG